MFPERRATVVVALVAMLVAMLVVTTACTTGSAAPDAATIDRQAAVANRAAVQRALAARQRATARRAATAAALRARRARRGNATTTTTTTVAPAVATPALASRPATRARDMRAIEQAISGLNTAFAASVAGGVTMSESANYWVGAGVYTSGECGSFEMARGGGVVQETLIVHLDSLAPAPGWVDPVIGRVPRGRIYRLAIDEVQTLVTTGQQRDRPIAVHVTVPADGRARLFLRCQ